MRTIKSISSVVSMIAALVLMTTSLGLSQRMSVEERVKMLQDSLKLNEDQAAKITKILEDQREEITTARSEHKGDREAMRAVLEEIAKKTDQSIKPLLNPGQVTKYEAIVKARQERMKKRAQGGGF